MKIANTTKSKSNKKIGFIPITSVLQESVDCCFEFKNPPYHISTLVFIGNPHKLISYVKKNYGDDLSNLGVDFNSIDGLTIPCTSTSGGKLVIIYLTEFHFSSSDFATLVHEIEHAVVYILKFSGCHPVMFENDANEDSDDESLAYLEGNMFNTIIQKLSKKFLTKIDKKKSSFKLEYSNLKENE